MKGSKTLVIATAAAVLVAALPAPARAHCDAMDGPVVTAGQKALQTGKVGPVLAWVKPEGEPAVRAAFERALAVRRLGGDAKALADQWFFETLVRVHRAGEGALFTGLKPAGLDFGPAIPAADKALETGSPQAALQLLQDAVHSGFAERFKAVRGRKAPGDDVAAGRAWVEAYVPFVHYVQGVYQAAKGEGVAHAEQSEAAAAPSSHGGARESHKGHAEREAHGH